MESLYQLVPRAAGVTDQAGLLAWRHNHVRNRWVEGGKIPDHLIVKNTANKAFLVLDVVAKKRSILVLEIGSVSLEEDPFVPGAPPTTVLGPLSDQKMKKKTPSLSTMYVKDTGAQRYSGVYQRGTNGFDGAMKLVGQAMGDPFYNLTTDLNEHPEWVSGLAGDTSDPALLVTGWKQGGQSSIVETVPFMFHAVVDDSEARTGAVLERISPKPGGVRHLTAKGDLDIDQVPIDFVSLVEWQTVAGLQSIRFDPLFESFVLTGLSSADLGSLYAVELNAIQKATEADPALAIQNKDTGDDLSDSFESASEVVGIHVTSTGLTLAPDNIKVVRVRAGKVLPATVDNIDVNVYAAVIHAYWTGISPSLQATQQAIATVEGPMGLDAVKMRIKPTKMSAAILAAIDELRPVAAPPPVTPVTPAPVTPTVPVTPVVIPPGVTVLPTSVIVERSSTKRWRSSKVLAREATRKKKLPVMGIEFLSVRPTAAEQLGFLIRETERPLADFEAMSEEARNRLVDEVLERNKSTIVATDVPLRKANNRRYPKLPYEFYYGIWYRNRAKGFLPGNVQVTKSQYDKPPSILVPVKGRVRISTTGKSAPTDPIGFLVRETGRPRAQILALSPEQRQALIDPIIEQSRSTIVFAYDLTTEKLDDAYDLTVQFPGTGAFTLGLKRDKPNFAAVETVSVSRKIVEP